MIIEKLKDLRMELNLKQEDVANILGISRGLYSQYEIGDKFIPLYHLNHLANYYNVSLDYIFSLAKNKNYSNNLEIKEIDKLDLGKKLKDFRKENGITLINLANELYTSPSTLSAYENGKTCILTSFLYEICKKYKISADYLLGKIDDPKYLK